MPVTTTASAKGLSRVSCACAVSRESRRVSIRLLAGLVIVVVAIHVEAQRKRPQKAQNRNKMCPHPVLPPLSQGKGRRLQFAAMCVLIFHIDQISFAPFCGNPVL